MIYNKYIEIIILNILCQWFIVHISQKLDHRFSRVLIHNINSEVIISHFIMTFILIIVKKMGKQKKEWLSCILKTFIYFFF